MMTRNGPITFGTMWRMMIRLLPIAEGARGVDIGHFADRQCRGAHDAGAARDRGIVIATMTFCTPVPKIETTRAP